MKLQNRVALRIKTIRKRRGLTQESLAEHVGRTADAISQLERGLYLPSFETLERLSDVMEVPIRDFFDGEGAKGESPRRDVLLATLMDVARNLSEKDLGVAVQVVELIAGKKAAK